MRLDCQHHTNDGAHMPAWCCGLPAIKSLSVWPLSHCWGRKLQSTQPHDSPHHHHPAHAGWFCGTRTQTDSVFHLAGTHRACMLFCHNRWPAFLPLRAALWMLCLPCSLYFVVFGGRRIRLCLLLWYWMKRMSKRMEVLFCKTMANLSLFKF